MSLIAWIIFGAIIGWAGSIITRRDQQMGCISNIIAGIAGALAGGFLGDILFPPGEQAVVAGIDLYSTIVSIAGAVIIITLWSAITGRRRI